MCRLRYVLRYLLMTVFLSMSFFCKEGFATVMRKLSLEALTSESDIIVIGKITNMKSEWNSQKTQIYTYITILVEQYIKGDLGKNEITIKQFGGEIDGIGMAVIGDAGFQKGEEILIFLRAEDGNIKIKGMNQGKFGIERHKATGRKIVLNNFGDPIAEIKDGFLKCLPRGESLEKGLSVEDFVNQIEMIIGTQKKYR